MLDVQQMHVKGSLERCIRLFNQCQYIPVSQVKIWHIYLRQVKPCDLTEFTPQPTAYASRLTTFIAMNMNS